MNRSTEEHAVGPSRAERFDLISRIADDIAHELKNPLNSIVINLEVLRSRVRAGHSDAALDRAEVIDAELRRLHALLEAMLRLMRPNRATRDVVAVGDVLEDVAALAQAQARVARKSLVFEPVPEDMIVRARADALRFTVLHVIQSALQAVPESSPGVRVAAARRGDAIALRVEAHETEHALLEGQLDGIQELLREAGVIESECRPLDGGSACTLLLAQAGEFA